MSVRVVAIPLCVARCSVRSCTAATELHARASHERSISRRFDRVEKPEIVSPWALDEQGNAIVGGRRRSGFQSSSPHVLSRRTMARKFLSSRSRRWQHACVPLAAAGKKSRGQFPNPTSIPAGIEQAVWSIGHGVRRTQKKLMRAIHTPSQHRHRRLRSRPGQLWLAPLERSAKPSKSSSRPKWRATMVAPMESSSPSRPPAVFTASLRLRRASKNPSNLFRPALTPNSSPQWSLDGNAIASFAGRAAARHARRLFHRTRSPHPWSILVGDISTAKPKENLQHRQNFQRFVSLHGGRYGGGVINWPPTTHSSWPAKRRLGNISTPLSANGGAPKLLHAGKCER